MPFDTTVNAITILELPGTSCTSFALKFQKTKLFGITRASKNGMISYSTLIFIMYNRGQTE